MRNRPIRVIQWTTGNVGRRALHAILGRSDMLLVGVYAHEAPKRGVDAAELAGAERPSGVLATGDVDALLALAPDACVYTPLWPSTDDLVRLLEAGVDVCTSSAWITGGTLPPHELARIEAACARGRATIYGSGAHPGMSNAIALALSGCCERVDRVSITESADASGYASAATQTAMGFGRDPAEPGLAEAVGRATEVFAEAVAMTADALGATLDRIDFAVTFTAAAGDSDLGFLRIPEGTVGGVMGHHRGWVGDHLLVSAGFNWIMGAHTTPPEPLRHGYDIRVHGRPTMRAAVTCLPPRDWDEEDYMGLGMIYTAMPVVNAVPRVVSAPPGIVTAADLPPVVGRAAGA